MQELTLSEPVFKPNRAHVAIIGNNHALKPAENPTQRGQLVPIKRSADEPIGMRDDRAFKFHRMQKSPSLTVSAQG